MATYYNFTEPEKIEDEITSKKVISPISSDKENLELLNQIIETQKKNVIRVLRNWIKDGPKPPGEGIYDIHG